MSAPIERLNGVPNTVTQKKIQTTERATSVATDRLYMTDAMRPNQCD